MIQYYVSALKKYATFTGRARRSEYWYFTLVNVLITYGLIFLGAALASGADSPAGGGLFVTIYALYSLGTLVPSLAAGVRRMHDVGKSGWFLLIPIYNLVLAVTPGQVGSNQYGPDPKAAVNSIVEEY